MEIQEKKEYSGLEPALPKRIFPYLLTAKNSKKKINTVTIVTYNQLKLVDMESFKYPNTFNAFTGNNPQNKDTPMIKIRLGIVIVLLKLE